MVMKRTPASEYLVGLRDVSLEDRDLAGVKAANLGALLAAGFPVPDGVVLTTRACREFGGAPESALEATTAVPAPLPGTVREALQAAVASWGEGRVAVRSSGVAEDLAGASFAGQYETVLNVDLDQVEDAVWRCWTSAFSGHATTYRERLGQRESLMAVLVQPMVQAQAAGVAFSANPVTGDRSQVVINAVRGLGDRLVAGEVSPDEWVVAEDDARCAAPRLGAIDAEQARAIAEMARQVEERFGCPQDIEWAISGGRLHLLQARPITSLPGAEVEPIPIDVEVPSGFWQHDASHMPSLGYPVAFFVFPLIRRATSRWAEEFGYLFDGLDFRVIGLRPYQRLVPFGGREGPSLPTWAMRLLVRAVPALRRRVRLAADAVRTDKPGRFIERWYAEWQPELANAIKRHQAVDLAALRDPDLDRHVASIRDLTEHAIFVHSVLHGALAPILYELATAGDELLGWDLAKCMDLLSGTSTMSTRPAHRLHDLASMAAGRPAVLRLLEHPGSNAIQRLPLVDPEFAEAFTTYLDEFGHRALGYTITEPTLAEKPELVLNMIRNQAERGYDPVREHEANATLRARTSAEARARLADQPSHRERFERLLERAERAYPVREDNEFFTISAPAALMRYAVLEIGSRLAGRGVIARPEDVAFVELEESRSALLHGGDLREMVQRRKGEREWAIRNPGPGSYGQQPPGPPSLEFLPVGARLPMESMLWSFDVMMALTEDRKAARPGALLEGIAASPGRCTGPVRVVKDETQFHKLQPGDVLVCPITSPVWSVLFPSIGALVTDTGGLLSHPAIIAREYQIPAVVATGEATSRLEDGQLVTVDGTAGTIAAVV